MTPRILGALALAAALAAAGSASAEGNAAKGKAYFASQCSLCHSVKPGENGAAPSLYGVVGRKAGSEPGFNYSNALKASGITWTHGSIEKFLAGPGKMVPGTAMPISVAKESDRDDLAAYLATLKK